PQQLRLSGRGRLQSDDHRLVAELPGSAGELQDDPLRSQHGVRATQMDNSLRHVCAPVFLLAASRQRTCWLRASHSPFRITSRRPHLIWAPPDNKQKVRCSMKVLFWIGLFGALYSYFLYPLLLMPLSRRRRRPLQPPAELPTISLIVTAHNEAARIKDKLENCLLLDYPRQRLEILVASDASSDGTDELVAGYAERGVRLIRAPERRGKEWAQLLAVQAARGEILVFSDVATTIPGDGLRRLAACFADPQVGAVSSEDRFVAPDGELLGEGL